MSGEEEDVSRQGAPGEAESPEAARAREENRAVQRLRVMRMIFSQLEEHRRPSRMTAANSRGEDEAGPGREGGQDPANGADDEAEAEARRQARREWTRGGEEGMSSGGEDDGEPAAPVVRRGGVVQRFKGHLNVATVKDVSWYGPHGEFVMSGSDCGHFFVWRARDGSLVQCLPADSHTVNVIDAHPWEPVVATCGIDNDIKLWEPLVSPARAARAPANFDAVVSANAQRLREMNAREGVPAGCALQ